MIIIVLVLIVIVSAILLVTLPNNKHDKIVVNEYQTIIDKINNKESFLIILTKKSSEMNDTFMYYIDAYDLDANYLTMDNKDEKYKELLKMLSLQDTGDNEIIMQYIKNGNPFAGIIGVFSESDFKKFLIYNKIIDSTYKDIDVLVDGNFNDYYSKNQSYCLLYIDRKNENLFKYRKKLVENHIHSLIMYVGGIESMDTEEYFNEKIDFKNNPEAKLPVTIKVQNNKILYSHSNVMLKDLIEKCN